MKKAFYVFMGFAFCVVLPALSESARAANQPLHASSSQQVEISYSLR